MAGKRMSHAQRQGAREKLDDVLREALSRRPSWKRTCYRQWLTTPSEGLRVLLQIAGEDVDHWHQHRVPALLARWNDTQADAA